MKHGMEKTRVLRHFNKMRNASGIYIIYEYPLEDHESPLRCGTYIAICNDYLSSSVKADDHTFVQSAVVVIMEI